MTDYERRQQIEKVLGAMNALEQQAAAIYGEVMRMSVKISEALKSKDTLDFVEQALAGGDEDGGSGAAERGNDELDIF
jgi:prefoldin subunit 5